MNDKKNFNEDLFTKKCISVHFELDVVVNNSSIFYVAMYSGLINEQLLVYLQSLF